MLFRYEHHNMEVVVLTAPTCTDSIEDDENNGDIFVREIAVLGIFDRHRARAGGNH
jgi:hypothetical protein